MTEQLLDISATVLRDGREVVIRPLEASDRAALTAFGHALPQDDLEYIEDDFQNPEVISRLINMHMAEHWRQIVATAGDAIVGYSAVRRLAGWSSHIGKIQLVVSGGWRRNGLGTILATQILSIAHELGTTQAVVEMLEEQRRGQAIFERLGFRLEGILDDQVRDRQGRRHNLLILAYQMR
jgi:ribosomal protein S18 acetylase RimI-like enzyme